MIPPFADTFYFIALLNPADDAHARAVEYSQLIERLVTTEWILLELADGLAESPARGLFESTRAALLADDRTQLMPMDQSIHQEAIDLYIARPDKGWSLTDCVSFVTMTRLGLRETLTADRHFEQAGFVAVLK